MQTFLLRILKLFMIIGATLEIVIYPIITIGSCIWQMLAVLFSRKCVRFRGPVTGVGAFLAPDKLFQKPNATLVHLAVLESTPDMSTVSNHLQSIYDLPDEHGKYSRKYAKLGFSLEPWWGYLFWTEIENFRIDDQVHFIHRKELDYNSVSHFVEEIIRKPFTKGQPLWELYVVTASSEIASKQELLGTKCFLIFRSHHLLLDGMSLIKLWYAADSVGEESSSSSSIPPALFTYGTSKSLHSGRSSWASFVQKLNIVCQTPFLASKLLLTPRDGNILTKDYKEFSGPWYCSGVNKIHVERYRQPLRDLQFSLTHALLVGYGRGLKKFMAENYGMANVPKSVHIMGSVPRPNYPMEEALTNHWAIMRYKAELTCTTLMGQLEHSKKEYKRAVHHIIPESFEQNHKFGMNRFPYKLYDVSWDTTKSGTLSLSNIPGPPTRQKMFGVHVTDRAVWLPLTRHNSGIGLLLLTYNGWGTISITADSGCIKSRKLFNHLNQSIMDEMKFVLDEVLRLSQQNQAIVQPGAEGCSDDAKIELREVKVV